MSSPSQEEESVCSTITPELVNRGSTGTDVTTGSQTFVVESEDEDTKDESLRPQSPTIIITPPPEPLTNSRRSWRLGNRANTTPKLKLKRKATASPPGDLHQYMGVKPQPPKRAVSERILRPSQGVGNQFRESPMRPLLPRIPLFGAPASRTLNSQGDTIGGSVGKMGLSPKLTMWRMAPQPAKKIQLVSKKLSDQTKSFSKKTRVKGTLISKKLGAIRFVDYKSKDLLGTPISMASTPQELHSKSGSRSGLTPLESLWAGKENIHPDAPIKPERLSLPFSPGIQHHETFKHRTSIAKAPPSEKPMKRVYIPGQIRLEQNVAAKPRRGSIATMEAFAEAEPKANGCPDTVALDEMIMFFQDMGMVGESTEEGLDRYWASETEANHQGASPARAVHSSSGSFSSEKGMPQDEKPPPSPSTSGRRKGGLRQLLKSSRVIL